MQVLDVIEQAQSGQAMASLARVFGIEEDEARAAAEAVIPQLSLALERNTLSRGGLADLVHALGQGHHEQILEMPEAWRDPRVVADGQAILAHVLGGEQKSRVLASRAARASGLGESVIQMLLPILAQLLMGAIARYTKGGLGDILSRLPIPGGGAPGGGQPGGGNWPRQEAPGDFETGGRMDERDRGGPGGGRGGSGFELPRGEMPKGGYPMPPIPGGPGEGSGRMPEEEPRRRGGFEMPWPQGRRGEGEADREDGEGMPGGRGRGGFELPRGEMPPTGGYPMPPIPGGPGEGSGRMPEEEPRRRGGFEMPWPQGGRREREADGDDGGGMPGGRGRGGFELPRGEMPPTGGYPMPPIPPGPSGLPDDSAQGPGRSAGGQGFPLPFPLPAPGQGGSGRNPYDDLSDILRRGGRAPGGAAPDAGGGGLGSVIRGMLGGLLGFGGRGIVGWIIRLIALRWGWRLLQRILLRR